CRRRVGRVRAEVQAARRAGRAARREASSLNTWLWVVVALGAFVLACLAWGVFEAGWPRFRVLELGVPGLPPELERMRIVHLSDFHLGVPSRGARASRL